jgi:hypothetical protein
MENKMENKKVTIEEHNMDVEIVGNILIGYPKNVPEQEIDLIRKIVRDAQEIKHRCKACCPCPMGVVGCDSDSEPHGHGSTKRCSECGVPYTYVHPHSNVCSLGTPIEDNVRHDDYHLRRQLEWKKDMY